ncbi:hypothetical protein [Aridibaculum aurantiacum]|uniref:hypothetical protein n=1 Tax=Aridibaculum aurantiacum TaxID=2810307 RepID=UPI001A971154|nr:hypothetical protein [Aridibaculum aurantiacum]
MIDNNNEENREQSSSNPVEGENSSRNRRAEESEADADGVYLTADSKLQSPEEYELDKNRDNTDDRITASSTDDHETNSGGVAGTDRAGTAERKDYGETKLNQGIEEQGGQKTYDLD